VPVNRSGSVTVRGLDELIREVKQLDNADEFEVRIKDANYKVGELVKLGSQPRIATQSSRAAGTMSVSRALKAARLSFGGPKAPWALGVEFGAHRDRRRIIKERAARISKSGKFLGWSQGRATILRDGEDVDKVIGRIERQTVDEQGRTQARGRGKGVKVSYKNGRPDVRLGWNQFRPWKGIGPDAGYAIFPFIKANSAAIVELYGDEIDKITGDAFPD
jgi:hypothetical protein